MAKLRRGHVNTRGAGGHMGRMFLMSVFVAVAVVFLKSQFSKLDTSAPVSAVELQSSQVKNEFPLHSSSGEWISHSYYDLSYLEKYEQAEWVSYTLTKKSLQKPNVKRTNWFDEDPSVSTKSAKHSDYKSTGYTRGHLVPAADMAFDITAMKETFLMSNISPQLRVFNSGVWRELEEQVRDWVYQKDSLHIVSGPVFSDEPSALKSGKIAIPDYFFKVLIFESAGKKESVAFLIPHQKSEKPLSEYMMSIDKLEQVTGIDYFMNKPAMNIPEVESVFNPAFWPVSESRYKLRISRWNND